MDESQKDNEDHINSKSLNIVDDRKETGIRSSEKKLTISFTENNTQQINFLQKASILKHLMKKCIQNREENVLKNSRSIRENYHLKVKENKLHTMINSGLIGIVKDKKKKTLKTKEIPKKKNIFSRKPTNVKLKKYFFLYLFKRNLKT